VLFGYLLIAATLDFAAFRLHTVMVHWKVYMSLTKKIPPVVRLDPLYEATGATPESAVAGSEYQAVPAKAWPRCQATVAIHGNSTALAQVIVAKSYFGDLLICPDHMFRSIDRDTMLTFSTPTRTITISGADFMVGRCRRDSTMDYLIMPMPRWALSVLQLRPAELATPKQGAMIRLTVSSPTEGFVYTTAGRIVNRTNAIPFGVTYTASTAAGHSGAPCITSSSKKREVVVAMHLRGGAPGDPNIGIVLAPLLTSVMKAALAGTRPESDGSSSTTTQYVSRAIYTMVSEWSSSEKARMVSAFNKTHLDGQGNYSAGTMSYDEMFAHAADAYWEEYEELPDRSDWHDDRDADDERDRLEDEQREEERLGGYESKGSGPASNKADHDGESKTTTAEKKKETAAESNTSATAPTTASAGSSPSFGGASAGPAEAPPLWATRQLAGLDQMTALLRQMEAKQSEAHAAFLRALVTLAPSAALPPPAAGAGSAAGPTGKGAPPKGATPTPGKPSRRSRKQASQALASATSATPSAAASPSTTRSAPQQSDGTGSKA